MPRVGSPAGDAIITLEMWTEIWRAQYDPAAQSKKPGKAKRKLRRRQYSPWFIWSVSMVQTLVFIAELLRNWTLTGTLIQLAPAFNPAVGPSVFVLINMGARFSPCMQSIPGITDNPMHYFHCPNYTGLTNETSCTLGELCGFTGSVPPKQWYRFVLAIFLHSGLIHVGLNLFTQLVVGTFIERKIGSVRVSFIYFVSGVFGLLADANFAPNGFATVGCSGAVFGLVGVYLWTIVYDWQRGSLRELLSLAADLIINLALGLLPSIGNFNHMGGFVMGVLLGVIGLRRPTRFRWLTSWMWSAARVVCVSVATVMFVGAVENVYSRRFECEWCRFLDCLPIRGWCEIGYLKANGTFIQHK